MVVMAIIGILVGLSFVMFRTASDFGDNLDKQSKDGIARVKDKPEQWPPVKRTPPTVAKKVEEPRKRPDPNPEPWPRPKPPEPDWDALKRAMPKAPAFVDSARRINLEKTRNALANRLDGHFRFDRPGKSLAAIPGLERLSLTYLGPKLTNSGAVMSDVPGEDAYSWAYLHAAPFETEPASPEFFCAAPAGNSLLFDTYPQSSAFKLHSNPGSKFIIYMDFDGHVTGAGNPWNSENGGNPITALAFSMDANRNSFSPVELAKIIDLWRMVAEDFLPFDVDVTTEDPGAAVMQGKGTMRAVIGPTPTVSSPSAGWKTAGGIAFLTSFNFGGDIVCWCWNGDSTPNPETSVPITVSHEVGHTLGLDHDADPPLGYYSGHGVGATGWGPIMGAPFGKNLTQWSKNTYPNADNPEDDVAIIAGKNGFGYRPDDHGNTTSSATPLNAPLQGPLATTYGIIEKDTDADYFVFYADPGPINIQIDPLFIGPNLDINAELYNSAGSLIATSNPLTKLDASFKMNVVDKGAFYIKISGTGLLPVLPAGYPTYGSLGSYRIQGVVTPLTPTFAAFKTLNPVRWNYNPFTKVYDGNFTIANISGSPISGKMTIVVTMPHPSITVLSPVGTVSGQTHSLPFTGTIAPGAPMQMNIRLLNPQRVPLLTGSNSYVTDIKFQ